MGDRLAGKVAVVTGAGSGIGEATARRFVAEGARVVLADLDRSVLDRLSDELGPDATRAVVTDVTSREQTVAATAAAVAAFGGLDVLVNSAGISRRNVAPDADFEAAWDRVMEVNLKGTLLMCHAAVERMRPTGGSIVNLASVMGQVVYDASLGLSDGFNPYPHSKGGVIQLSRDLGVSLARDGIRVNAVCPGFCYTNLTRGVTENPPLHEALAARHPLGRLGTAEEIANVITFLASDEASFVTAAAWMVDGGYTAV
ncbi:MAG: SDR family oxidoreductase [Ectothiorhodospiraceae bacterium]|nr:SDR family oxidoreductase [Ectothiorhodospiraceae bacterium]